MAKVLFVKADEKRKRVQIGILEQDSSSILTVKESTYISIGCPARDDEIGDVDLSSLKFEDETFRALKKAVSLLADVDRSRRELKAKLVQKGFSAEAIDIALDVCERREYLNEARQLERLIEREANRKLRGRYYIKRKLMAKGYSSRDIDRVTDALLEREEIDFYRNFDILCEKKCAVDESDVTALKYKYGYKI